MPLPRPLHLVTIEYTPYSQLLWPDVVDLLARHRVTPCLCVRADQADYGLHQVLTAWEEAGIHAVLWPLLPREEGLYLNKGSVDAYRRHLERVLTWARNGGHAVDGVLVDVEPSKDPAGGKGELHLLRSLRGAWRSLDRQAFQASIPAFQQVARDIRDQGAMALCAAMPMVVEDAVSGRSSWEDLAGGPVRDVEWDAIFLMIYTTWFAGLGLGWRASERLAWSWVQDAVQVWGDRLVVGLGVTNPGEGGENLTYGRPERLAAAVAAVRAAGAQHVGLYDLEGILDSREPDIWLRTLAQTGPQEPEGGQWGARLTREALRRVGGWLERGR